jgi:dTDP-4-dehydrorhamnose reductase
MRVLITGGSGYLGAELVRQALGAGWEVIATYFSRRPAVAGVQYLPLDIRDDLEAEQVFAEAAPTAIIHTAYRQDGPDLWTATAEGAGVVAQAAQQAGARLIHLSSDVVFDGERAGRYTEADPPSPITPYGEAKAAAGRLVAAAHPQPLIVRTSLIYGGTELSKHEQFVLDAADGRIDVDFFTDELRCPTAVGDLAAALLELAIVETSGILHLAADEVVSRYDFACLVAQAHGRAPDGLRAGLSAASGLRRPRNCALDSSRARGLLRTRLQDISAVLGGNDRRSE